MASTYVPPLSPLSHRPARVAYGQRAWTRTSYPLLLIVAAGVFIVSAAALLLAQTGLLSRPAPAATSAASATVGTSGGSVAPVPQLAPADVEKVMAYARGMQPDDALVQVKPGVFAKRSNVQGVTLNGATVYYDIVPHQSYGPLRTGQVTEQQVNVVARQAHDGFMVTVYTRK
jgi:hypothetical protein